MYRLKRNVADFVVVDGPFAKRTFRAGKIYAEIPPGEKHKFEDASARRKPASAGARYDYAEAAIPGPPRKTKKRTR